MKASVVNYTNEVQTFIVRKLISVQRFIMCNTMNVMRKYVKHVKCLLIVLLIILINDYTDA